MRLQVGLQSARCLLRFGIFHRAYGIWKNCRGDLNVIHCDYSCTRGTVAACCGFRSELCAAPGSDLPCLIRSDKHAEILPLPMKVKPLPLWLFTALPLLWTDVDLGVITSQDCLFWVKSQRAWWGQVFLLQLLQHIHPSLSMPQQLGKASRVPSKLAPWRRWSSVVFIWSLIQASLYRGTLCHNHQPKGSELLRTHRILNGLDLLPLFGGYSAVPGTYFPPHSRKLLHLQVRNRGKSWVLQALHLYGGRVRPVAFVQLMNFV